VIGIECEHCGRSVKPTDRGLFQYVSGWAMANRSGGGVNALRERISHPRFSCEACMTARRYGADSAQTSLFDETGVLS
jgi:hypothetical protein